MNNANLRNKILTIDENFKTTYTRNEEAQNSGTKHTQRTEGEEGENVDNNHSLSISYENKE
uniref:Uncharacterized protein n=1 Tax=Schistosoma mansoni TaxID=6183 RepID=A0A5K4F7X1_SCHMA